MTIVYSLVSVGNNVLAEFSAPTGKENVDVSAVYCVVRACLFRFDSDREVCTPVKSQHRETFPL